MIVELNHDATWTGTLDDFIGANSGMLSNEEIDAMRLLGVGESLQLNVFVGVRFTIKRVE